MYTYTHCMTLVTPLLTSLYHFSPLVFPLRLLDCILLILYLSLLDHHTCMHLPLGLSTFSTVVLVYAVLHLGFVDHRNAIPEDILQELLMQSVFHARSRRSTSSRQKILRDTGYSHKRRLSKVMSTTTPSRSRTVKEKTKHSLKTAKKKRRNVHDSYVATDNWFGGDDATFVCPQWDRCYAYRRNCDVIT